MREFHIKVRTVIEQTVTVRAETASEAMYLCKHDRWTTEKPVWAEDKANSESGITSKDNVFVVVTHPQTYCFVKDDYL